MSTLTPELWAEHLRASSVIRHGMILEDMERGIDAEQIASRQRTDRFRRRRSIGTDREPGAGLGRP
jgi:hypothetical protein